MGRRRKDAPNSFGDRLETCISNKSNVDAVESLNSVSTFQEKSVEFWSVNEVGLWLIACGFKKHQYLLCEEHFLDGSALLACSENDLREVGITALGDRKRLWLAIDTLRCRDSTNSNEPDRLTCGLDKFETEPVDFVPQATLVRRKHRNKSEQSIASSNDEVMTSQMGEYSLKSELVKCFVSFIYVECAFLVTAYVMVLAHERVPQMKDYPPLPDIMLDNLPHIGWAFEMAEAIGLALGLMWLSLLLFHRYRFVILRRTFALTGTIFLLRSVTMIITSLSVPGKHLDCQPYQMKNVMDKVERAFHIWINFGMSLKGVQTCGDYMFSGHTCVLTLFNFFVTEYTPRNSYYFHIHTISWLLNIFGIFFILAAHEHYSIDVFIAFYLCSRLFLYYHTLANNRHLMTYDRKRTRIWFPLFHYFEGENVGAVPNRYEYPWTAVGRSRLYRWLNTNAHKLCNDLLFGGVGKL